MRDHLPEEVLWQRHKLGLEVPQKLWLVRARPQIAAWLTDLPRDCPINGAAILDRVDTGRRRQPVALPLGSPLDAI